MTTDSRFTQIRRASLAFAIGSLLCAASDATAGPGVSIVVAHPPSIRDGDRIVGALPPSREVHLEVALQLRNRGALDALVAGNAATQAAGGSPRLLGSGEVLAEHAPTPAQAQSVANWLISMGFRNVQVASNRLLVSADGNAIAVRRAFLTGMVEVDTHDGRVAYANTGEARIPAAMADRILAVVGLQDVHRAHTFVQLRQSPVRNHAVFVHDPTEFPSIYGWDGTSPPTNVIVGIITQGSLANTRADLATWEDIDGLPRNPTLIVNTNGTSGDTSNTAEWDLDSQDIIGMVGGQVRQLIFYNIPTLSDTNLTADFNTVVADDKVKIVNASLGECETDAQGDGSAAAQDTILEIAVAQGQTFAVATGDSGADECPLDGLSTFVPSWPAASQYVVAVAGTTLNTNINTDAWTGESVWSGSGGSESTFEPKPSWQARWTGTNRGVADVAFDADPSSGALIIYNQDVAQAGGTSLSAPLFAGAWAHVLHQYPTIGFAGPIVYAEPAANFHDVRTGSNGIAAVPGYDLASGRGSILISPFVAAAAGRGNRPPVAGFSYVTSVLKAAFTDTSTDPDGNLAIHAWDFGDGGVAHTANPTHAYAATGTYSVTETVKDQVGAAASKTQSVTIGTTPLQLVRNLGFESGIASPWTMPAGVQTDDPSHAFAGNWYAAIGNGGSGAHTDTVSQRIALPAGFKVATLAFEMNIATAETTPTNVDDHLDVQVWSADGGTLLGTLGSFSNLDAGGGYVSHSFDMKAWIGQTVMLEFVGTNDATLPTTWALDDVTLREH